MEHEKSNGNANETTNNKSNSNEELLEQIPVENTPFTVIRQEKDYFVVMGKYRLTEKLETKEQALEAALDESWFRLMQIMRIMIEEYAKEKKELELITKANPELIIKK